MNRAATRTHNLKKNLSDAGQQKREDMQDWIDDAVEAVARADLGKPSDEGDPDEAPDYGFFHDPQIVLYTWLFHKTHGTLPDVGGLLDQDWQLVFDDWGTLNCRYHAKVMRLRDDDGSLDDLVGDDPQNVDRLFE